MDAEATWFAAVRAALHAELAAFGPDWVDDGAQLVGPGGVAVLVATQHEAGPGHVDLGFRIADGAFAGHVFWDCVAGGSAGDEAAARFAATVWARSTAPAMMELVTRTGQYGDHCHGDPALGLARWHSIHGPILTYGQADTTALRAWCRDHPVIPILQPLLEPELGGAPPHGVKFLLGAFGPRALAEVRVDGRRCDAASDALLAWPKDGPATARFFTVFVHPL